MLLFLNGGIIQKKPASIIYIKTGIEMLYLIVADPVGKAMALLPIL